MSVNYKIGVKNHARSPGSIVNAEHHDPTGANKGMKGNPGTIKLDAAGNPLIFADTNVHAVENYAILKVTNTAASVAFLWTGNYGDEPLSPDITNALAIPPNHTELIYMGGVDSPDSKAFKASAGTLQVVIIES